LYESLGVNIALLTAVTTSIATTAYALMLFRPNLRLASATSTMSAAEVTIAPRTVASRAKNEKEFDTSLTDATAPIRNPMSSAYLNFIVRDKIPPGES
jgi:hypothetical protein